MFGAVKLTKHVDFDLYKYSVYGIGFDRKGSYSIGNEVGRNVIIYGVDMSTPLHTTQGLEHTLTEEILFPINFTKEHTNFCLSYGANTFFIC